MPRKPGTELVQAQAAPRWRFEINMHPAQKEIYEDKSRFKVIAAGRRFGKTMLCTAECCIEAASKPDANVMWIAPAHRQARMAMRQIEKLIPKKHREINRTTQEVFLSTGGRMSFVSGERPDNLRGEGLDLVVIDEAAFIDEALWTQAVRPALADKLGRALLISTFMGENWFYDLYRYAIDPENVEWEGWKFPTSANPYVPKGEIEEARRMMTREVFEQEFEASPRAFSGAVFDSHKLDGARALAADLTLPAVPKCEGGLDWGWNVTALEICVELSDGRIAWIDEQLYKKVELADRCEMIAAKCREHRVETLYTDAATPTANFALAKVFEQAGCPTFVQPVPFAAYKRPGIMARSYYLERGREILTPTCRQLLIDSKAYHYDPKTPSLEKPAKGNDHTVDAATAFYASRAYELGDELLREVA